MIIDFHTHCFPDYLAPRAMEQLKLNASIAKLTAHTDDTTALFADLKDFIIE